MIGQVEKEKLGFRINGIGIKRILDNSFSDEFQALQKFRSYNNNRMEKGVYTCAS